MHQETVEDAWWHFAADVMHPDADESQHIEMRRAFYAGVHWLMHGPLKGAGSPDVSEPDALSWLQAVIGELEAFAADVREGRA